jgi:hypothetical protein
VRDKSSVCTSLAFGLTLRIACIDSTVALHWTIRARMKVASLVPCGYHTPFKPENRAVVQISLTGV